MADGVTFKLEGAEELNKKLKGLSNDLKYKGGRFALRKAGAIVLKAAKANAEKVDDLSTGQSITDNLALRWSPQRFKSTGDLMFRVGVMRGAKFPPKGTPPDKGFNSPTPHWRLLEFGTEKMSAKPFMRQALENNVGAATREFITQYDKAIDRYLKKIAKGK